IREAIAAAMPEVSVIGWPNELSIGDGLDESAQLSARNTARRWMKQKNCHLLVSGRMKSANVVSLSFTPFDEEEASAKELLRGTQTYTLAVDTMDIATKFMDDLAAALAACVIANVYRYRSDGLTPVIERLVPQIAKVIHSETSVMDVRTKARLM